MIPKNVYEPSPKRIDYLPEMLEKVRAKKPVQIQSRLNNQSDWMDYVKKQDLSQRDKIEIIKIKSEAMEQRALQYERGHQREEANQLYLDSIKAKMALIEQL